jgi:hypothetical protein
MSRTQRFRALCRLLRLATLVVFTGLALLFLVGAVGAPWMAPAGTVLEGRTHALVMGVFALPGLGYLWALWALQRTLADLAAGRLFHATVARGMRHMGAGVLAGALANVFLVTNLLRWITGGRGSYLYFDLSGIVLGVIGAALLLLAFLVDQARAAQDELDGIL